MTNIRSIAKKANVSIATVSRYMDPAKRHLLIPGTQKRVAAAIKRYRYIPNPSARALSKQITDTIGMVTPFSADIVKSAYFENLIAGIIEGIKPLTHDLKWIMIRDEDIRQCNLKMLLQKYSVDGVVFLAWRIFPNLVKEIERHANLPAVLINDYEPFVRSSIVYCDNTQGVKNMCAYFANEKNYTTIGMLRGPEYISLDAKERFQAFCACAGKFKFKMVQPDRLACDRFEEAEGFRFMSAWIEKGGLPRAVFCANDDLARGALRALWKNNFRIPADIAVAGFDDSDKNAALNPPLTSVRQPLEKMGRTAIEMLSGFMTKKIKPPVQIKLTPEIIIRESA